MARQNAPRTSTHPRGQPATNETASIHRLQCRPRTARWASHATPRGTRQRGATTTEGTGATTTGKRVLAVDALGYATTQHTRRIRATTRVVPVLRKSNPLGTKPGGPESDLAHGTLPGQEGQRPNTREPPPARARIPTGPRRTTTTTTHVRTTKTTTNSWNGRSDRHKQGVRGPARVAPPPQRKRSNHDAVNAENPTITD